MRFFDYGEEDWMPCERCGGRLIDIHHIFGRIGALLNDIFNLIGLCRLCHNLAHAEKITKEQLKEIHLKFMKEHGPGGVFNINIY
jgi:ethanolamine utilization protein EutA (predicted chaperonin)